MQLIKLTREDVHHDSGDHPKSTVGKTGYGTTETYTDINTVKLSEFYELAQAAEGNAVIYYCGSISLKCLPTANQAENKPSKVLAANK